MKLLKILFLSLLCLFQFQMIKPMDVGIDALGYIAQDVYEPVAPLVVPIVTIAAASALAYVVYQTYQLGQGLQAAAQKVGIATHADTALDTFLLTFKTVMNAVHLSNLPATERKKEIKQTVKHAFANKLRSKFKAFKNRLRRR